MLLLIVLGLALGSFVNVLVWRIRKRRDWVHGRSRCEHCHHVLGPLDLIPVLSWVLLKGRCRYCQAKIKDSSPLVELALPALFVLSYLCWPVELRGAELFEFAVWLVLLIGLTALAVYDLRWKLLPDKLVFPFAALAALQVITLAIWQGDLGVIIGAVLGTAAISGTFYILFQVSKGTWIGGGDVKLGLILGPLAGGLAEGFLLLFAASVTGLVVSLPLLARGKADAKTQLPFGPFLILALIIVKLFSSGILDWYSRLINV